MKTAISRDLHDEAAEWCARLAHDRSKSSWSIRFTHADIESSLATQLAWKAHCVIKEQLGRETPPQILWTKAEELLRGGWGRQPKKTPAKTTALPKLPPPPKPPPSAPPKPTLMTKPPPKKTPKKKKKKKEQNAMAKKQTRRSISVSQKLYARAKTFAAEKGVALSQLTEAALAHAIEHFYRAKK